MPYNASRGALRFRKKIETKGKQKALIAPSFKPMLERIIDPISLIALISSLPLYYLKGWPIALAAFLLAMLLIGIREFFIQDDHSLIRIYGPLGRIRYMTEDLFRDKYLQYFNETNTDGRPIPKIVRDYIYQKAHAVKSFSSFGTELDIFDEENSAGCRVLHRNFPGEVASPGYEVSIGEKREGVRTFPVKNILNVSAMSFGSINEKAAECLSFGAKDLGYVNTGEGGYGPHGIAGNDVVFQIGTGKFGVGEFRDMPDGSQTRILNEKLLKELVQNNSNIRMLQLKISQGAKPGLGGHLPGSKVTPRIAEVRRVPVGRTVISPPRHTELLAATPKEMVANLMNFCERLRKLTELPVGIKLCVGALEEVDLLVEAMKVTGKGPDAIQLDGSDGGTGAAPNIFVNYVGYGGAIETAAYLDGKLKAAGIRDRVVISAAGRILTPAHGALAFACGIDIIDTARGAMLALGCIQALKCHTNHCPTGITTQSPWRAHGLSIPEKSTRVHHYLKGFHNDMLKLTGVIGHKDPRDITLKDLRTITNRDKFAEHFDTDPFGLRIPTYGGDTVDNAVGFQ